MNGKMKTKQFPGFAFIKDDGGFSTVGMALALLISLSLVLSAAQVYKIRSVAASVQNVADSCALAAEKQVASFYLVAQMCDSVVFSLSFAGTTLVGIGIVAACVPPARALSTQLVNAGKEVLQARNKFAKSACDGLNRLQALLPVFAALNAAVLAGANSIGGSTYRSIAMLVPFDGIQASTALPASEEEILEDIEQQQSKIADAAQNAEEAIEQMNAHKLEAYRADCGSAPSYCMYERFETLTGITGNENPLYSSVDAWSFSVALKRAQAYYRYRNAYEQPANESIEEQARSAIRSHFYRYACEVVDTGYVVETEKDFDAYLPLLPRNTEEMRSTRLYTEDVYPVSENEESGLVMHAWDGCPGIEGGLIGYGSVALLESEQMLRCEICAFGAASVGKVAAASSSIENGFEYHYRIVAEQAALYQQEYKKYAAAEESVKNPVQDVFNKLENLLGESLHCRIHIAPPGRIGAIAIVVASGGNPGNVPLLQSIVPQTQFLGTRLSISAATLANDDSNETKTIITSLLDNLLKDSVPVGIAGKALEVWSGLLVAYTKANTTISETLENVLNSIPLVSATGLGSWASGKFKEIVNTVGLAPPDLVSHKPVVVNTYHVAAKDSSSFAQGLISAKQALGGAYGGIAQDPISAAIGIAGGKLLSSYNDWDATFTIARIELFGDRGVSIPVEITLPSSLKDAGQGAIEQALDALLNYSSSFVEVGRWE